MTDSFRPIRYRFPKRVRLSGRKAFARVFGGKHSAGNRFLVVYAIANDLDYARLGLSVGRRCGNAVVRGRIKRLLREAFRLERLNLPSGFDFVCVPRPGQIPTLDQCRRNLSSLFEKAATKACK